MGKQCNRGRNPEKPTTGNVTPVQVAFIVDCYLSENNYTKTLSIFRNEASVLISRTKGREAPKNLLSLGAILEEYISLKEQKVIMDQEKRRVDMMLQGIQDVIKVYNSPVPTISSVPAVMPQVPQIQNGSAAGYPVYTHVTNSVPVPFSQTLEPSNISTPAINVSSKCKRKASRPLSATTTALKRTCTQTLGNSSTGTLEPSQATNANAPNLSSYVHLESGSSVQRPSVAKSLFNHSPQSQSDTACPQTPPQALAAQLEKPCSPLENSSHHEPLNIDTPPEICSHVFTSKTIVVSPFKHAGCSPTHWTHRISPSSHKLSPKRLIKREDIKGRLDFNDSNESINLKRSDDTEFATSASAGEAAQMIDFDIPEFDFGADFSLSELLVDMDFDTEGIYCQPLHDLNPAGSFFEGSEKESANGGMEPSLSCVTTVLSEKDMNRQGSDSLVSMKSITKCINVSSPAKSGRSSSLRQENLPVRDK